MFCHPALAVGNYSSGPPAAELSDLSQWKVFIILMGHHVEEYLIVFRQLLKLPNFSLPPSSPINTVLEDIKFISCYLAQNANYAPLVNGPAVADRNINIPCTK